MREYEKLHNQLKKLILGGSYAAGQKIPTERAICEQFEVSRITTRHALRLLEEQGLVERFQGRGTFVKSMLKKKLDILTCDFTGSIRQVAPTMERTLVNKTITKLPEHISESANYNSNEDFLLIERLDCVGDETIAHDKGYILAKYAGFIEDEWLTRIDFYDIFLQEARIELSHGQNIIEAIKADDESAKKLSVIVGSPLLLVTDLEFTNNLKLLSAFESYYRADRIKLNSTNIIKKEQANGRVNN